MFSPFFPCTGVFGFNLESLIYFIVFFIFLYFLFLFISILFIFYDFLISFNFTQINLRGLDGCVRTPTVFKTSPFAVIFFFLQRSPKCLRFGGFNESPRHGLPAWPPSPGRRVGTGSTMPPLCGSTCTKPCNCFGGRLDSSPSPSVGSVTPQMSPPFHSFCPL